MAQDYKEFDGQKVTITLTDGETVDGTVEAGSPIGVVLKIRNSQKSELIEADKISDVAPQEAGEKKLKSKSLPKVKDGKNRAHLLDRHGYALADINGLTEEQAKDFHGKVDHTPLGHFHREDSAVEEAIAEASE